jgi:alpha-L-rhamnosidase
VIPGDWGAKWISFSQHPEGDMGVFAFRKHLSLPTKPTHFNLKVSADQRYKLYVNGRFIGFGPQRGDLHHWFYETYDVAPFLREGSNWIVVQVAHFGRYAPMAQHTARQGMVVHAEGVSTPEGWQVAKIPGWTFEMLHSDLGPFYIDVGPGEILDAAQLGWGWEQGGGDLEWREPNVISEAVDRGGGGGGTPWMLVPRTLPLMRHDRREQTPVEREGDAGKPFAPRQVDKSTPLILDYQELLCAFPRFTLQGAKGTKVKLTFAEGFFQPNGQKGHRDKIEGKKMWGYQDELVLDAEPRTFETAWWRTYRYLRIEADALVQVQAVDAFETGYPIEEAAKFTADGTDKIWEVAVRTVERCAGETYFDCPYYEQLQYAGDTRIQALIGYYLSRDRALQRNAVDQFAWSTMPDGLTQSRYPSRQTQVIPPFSLWWVLMLYDQWLYDRVGAGRRHLALAHRVIDAWDRLIEGPPERAFWTFGDWVPGWQWGEPPGKARASMHLFTKWLAELALAKMEGAHGRIDAIRSAMEGVERLENGLVFHPQDPLKAPNEHAAAVFRLCQQMAGLRPDPWPDKGLADAAKCTYYFSYYKHLAKNPADYLAELDPWRHMIDEGLTTFAENPEPTRSDCHAWSAHPILGFFQIVAGVTSTAEGWRRCRIAPRPGRLRAFRAEIPHPDGPLVVSLQDGQLEVDCPVPYDLVWADATGGHEPGQHRF